MYCSRELAQANCPQTWRSSSLLPLTSSKGQVPQIEPYLGKQKKKEIYTEILIQTKNYRCGNENITRKCGNTQKVRQHLWRETATLERGTNLEEPKSLTLLFPQMLRSSSGLFFARNFSTGSLLCLQTPQHH